MAYSRVTFTFYLLNFTKFLFSYGSRHDTSNSEQVPYYGSRHDTSNSEQVPYYGSRHDTSNSEQVPY